MKIKMFASYGSINFAFQSSLQLLRCCTNSKWFFLSAYITLAFFWGGRYFCDRFIVVVVVVVMVVVVCTMKDKRQIINHRQCDTTYQTKARLIDTHTRMSLILVTLVIKFTRMTSNHSRIISCWILCADSHTITKACHVMSWHETVQCAGLNNEKRMIYTKFKALFSKKKQQHTWVFVLFCLQYEDWTYVRCYWGTYTVHESHNIATTSASISLHFFHSRDCLWICVERIMYPFYLRLSLVPFCEIPHKQILLHSLLFLSVARISFINWTIVKRCKLMQELENNNKQYWLIALFLFVLSISLTTTLHSTPNQLSSRKN